MRFICRDRACNFHEVSYAIKGWILLLGFPVGLMNDMCIHQAVASFGKLLRWHNSHRIKSYVLVKCIYKYVNDVPRSIVLTQDDESMGLGCSWIVLVYVPTPEDEWWLGNIDTVANQEDDVPPNGNPHPLPEDDEDEEFLQAEGDFMENLVNQNVNGPHGDAQGDPIWENARLNMGLAAHWPPWPQASTTATPSE